MCSNFLKIPIEEREKIINVCIKEFAKNGYERASTNRIVQEADIPKGTLFYFFGNKKKLYFYVIDYAINLMVERLKSYNKDFSSDIFERFEQNGLRKLKLAFEEPLLYELIYRSVIDTPEELRNEIYNRYKNVFESNNKGLYEGIDTSRFKDDIDVKKAVDTIVIFLEGFFNRHTSMFKKLTPAQSLNTYKKLSRECREYFDILKKGIYK